MEEFLLKIEQLKKTRDVLRNVLAKVRNEKEEYQLILQKLKEKEISVNETLSAMNKELSEIQQMVEKLQKEKYERLSDKAKDLLKQAKSAYEQQRLNIINEDLQIQGIQNGKNI